MRSTKDFFANVDDFVSFSGGDTSIKKILIANNGIGATKAIRSIQRWSYETFGNEKMIKFVVMATPEDLNANAEYIRLADEVVDVPGGTNNNNYANINLICEISQRLRVDAVMPMWGHASENPLLPTSLSKLSHKVTFIGPPAEPMQALGDKIGSTIIAQSAGVPTIAWNGDGLTVDYQKTGIPQEVYDMANVTTAEAALQCSDRIGYPVMIKASEGGGGKGIRKVLDSSEVLSSYRQVAAEIPGSPIFVMKMASKARHLEVQLLADKYGEAIALSGRDCSVQRRHQKIIEEGPPTAASAEKFREMELAAVSLAKTVGYCNAGTVEFLYMEETAEFAFLELNPRLQVEHPVTENILGINLPACQLQVAMGLPLHRIQDVRKMYGRHPLGQDTIDFMYSQRLPLTRHCIAVRVTAENPEAGFQPTSGTLQQLDFKSSVNVWGYFSINSSGSIHEFADSQFGHIFASGPDRESARRAMLVALKELVIRGDIRTTVEYITRLMTSQDFVSNRIDTAWLDGRLARHKELMQEEGGGCDPRTAALCGAAVQGVRYFEQREGQFLRMLQLGQVPPKDELAPVVNLTLIYADIKYTTVVRKSGQSTVTVSCNGQTSTLTVRLLSDKGYLLDLHGQSHLAYATKEPGGTLRLVLDGHTCLFPPEYDPTRLTSSVAGKLARHLVSDGSHCEKGEPYVEIEAMKMYMCLRTAEAGTVHFRMSEGAVLAVGSVIAEMSLDNPEQVVLAEPFLGLLSPGNQQSNLQLLPHVMTKHGLQLLETVLEGYLCGDEAIEKSLEDYMQGFDEPQVAICETEEALAVLRGRVDPLLAKDITDALARYRGELQGSTPEPLFPAAEMLTALHEHNLSLAPAKRGVFLSQTAVLWATIEKYLYSKDLRKHLARQELLEQYIAVERLFDSMSYTDVVSEQRRSSSSEPQPDLTRVLRLCRSHANLPAKNLLAAALLESLKQTAAAPAVRPDLPLGLPLRSDIHARSRGLKLVLKDLAALNQPAYRQISHLANLVLMQHSNPHSQSSALLRVHDAVHKALLTGDKVGEGDRAVQLQRVIESQALVLQGDLLLEALRRQDSAYQEALLELYLLKTYQRTHRLLGLRSGHSLQDTGDLDKTNNVWIRFDFMTKAIKAVDTSRLRSEGEVGLSDLVALAGGAAAQQAETTRRQGIIATIDSSDDLARLVPLIVGKLSASTWTGNGFVNAVHVVLLSLEPKLDLHSDDDIAAYLTAFLSNSTQLNCLHTHGVKRISFLVGNSHVATPRGAAGRDRATSIGGISSSSKVSIFTFRHAKGYAEDRLFRYIEAPQAFHLDLPRLSNFNVTLDSVQTSSGNVFLYKAAAKPSNRYFARLVSFATDAYNGDIEALFCEAIDHMGIAVGRETAQKIVSATPTSGNNIFFNIVIPDHVANPALYAQQLQDLCTKYSLKMLRLAVSTVEVKLTCRLSPQADPVNITLVATNPTGFVLQFHSYFEAAVSSQSSAVYRNLSGVSEAPYAAAAPGPWHDLPAQAPYPQRLAFEQKRAQAMAASDTLYVYDWPALFEFAVRQQLRSVGSTAVAEQDSVCSCRELVLCDPTGQPLVKWEMGDEVEMRPMDRAAGLNDTGMVAWLVDLRTAECPSGRQIVIICNDITFQNGSFGTREDVVFQKASEYARHRGLPRLFLSANSGARIGMAQSLKDKFQVCWTDESDPTKGFQYIYLLPAQYSELLTAAGSVEKLPVVCTAITTPAGEERFIITDIIGEEGDLGVENLKGSGLIAGETSRAYEDIFTLTLVVGRTVGIGAYLVRLGQRTVQKTRSSPIILTGYQALNKLMGREIYTTNDQLGGPMIMFPNGVSHLLAQSHLQAVTQALQWLAFVPAQKGGPLPLLLAGDSVDRPVQFSPAKGLPYDPRHLLCGDAAAGSLGFLDGGSFIEVLGGWAKTVVVGRGRLGGVPLGVIVTENRTSELTKPADPADASSSEKMVQQAGGVWFPDSAYKTAQALRDFNREGLPCIIFANWRGFSGGQRDMFDEVLKFGSMIVDALVAYGQPLFVYIPPHAELRGGAWVVVDSAINPDVMEFYAAEDSRGGVLEAAGAASIKFRAAEVAAMARRMDPQLKEWAGRLKLLQGEEQEALQLQMTHREGLLLGVFQQIAVHFADLHDTPGRMLAKGVIRKQVQWEKSRTFFYWRLRRRLLEFSAAAKLGANSNRKRVSEGLATWFLAQGGLANEWEDDKRVVSFFEQREDMLAEYIAEKVGQADRVQLAVALSTVLGPQAADRDVRELLALLPEEARARLLHALSSSQ